MLRVRIFSEGRVEAGGEALLGRPGLTWVDVTEPDEATLDALGSRYGLHRLALEDCLHLDQRPKLEDYAGHQFIVLQGFSSTGPSLEDIALRELHFFLGDSWLITVHADPSLAVEQVLRRVDTDPGASIGQGLDFVAYLITDALVDSNFPVVEQLNDALDALEDQVFEPRAPVALMQQALDIKRTLSLLRRVLSPQRDVVGLLARRGAAHVQERTSLYFRDVYDHLARVHEQLDAARDLVSNLVDAYLSVAANRTADVSKQLTIFATIFLPLSFVVGFFGQNFDLLSGPVFFWLMLGLMVGLPVGMFIWFRHKDWL